MSGRLRIEARFTGNTSCGFISGWLYEIDILRRHGDPYLWVVDVHGPGCCPYSTMAAVTANWMIPADKAGHAFRTEYNWQREHERPVGNGWLRP